MNIEKEYKTLISYNDYQKMMDFYHVIPRTQVNFYFDTPDGLASRGLNVRIRQIHETFIFTLKHHADHLYEYEFEIPSFSLNHPEIITLLNQFGITNLTLLGHLTTHRAMIVDDYGELCIDANEYFDQKDYEVEYELLDPTSDHLAHFIHILQSFDIDYVDNKDSKTKRFKSALLKDNMK